MDSFASAMNAYHQQLAEGSLQVAYRGLMQLMLALRARFDKACPTCDVSALYPGYMDMTYFAIVTPALKPRRLKIAVVFLHEACRFEAWLSAANKTVQSEYWHQIKDSGWNRYRLVPTLKGADSIIEHVIVDSPDFADLDALSARIERETLAFTAEVERFLAQPESQNSPG